MRIMVLVKATDDSERGGPIDPAMLEAMGRFNDDLIAAGIFVTAGGLGPTSSAVRMLFAGTDRIVSRGPFMPAEELVAGFWIWQVDSMEQAIEWARRCPNPMPGPSTLELRPFHDLDESL